MKGPHSARKFMWRIILLLFWIPAASAQTLNSVGAVQSAAAILFTPEYVQVPSGCSSTQKVAIPPGSQLKIQDLCDPSRWEAKRTEDACAGRTMAVLAVNLRGISAPVHAETVALTADGNFHIRLFGNFEDAHGPQGDLESIRRVEWCVGATVPVYPEQLKKTACVEGRQIAVAFDYNAPLSNKILTNGFSFYVRVAGSPPHGFQVETFAGEVLGSFQRAITIWVAALADHDNLLTPQIRDFVKTRTSSSGSYTLLTPPQVVRLQCPHAATFVVELNFGGDGVFPRLLFGNSPVLAKARVEGRTIALNMRDIQCFKMMDRYNQDKQLVFEDNECLNLLPVLAHEIGHAFGIPHIDDAVGVALMNQNLSLKALVPTDVDVRAFVLALGKSVTGARPGVLEFQASEGVLPPKDWKARPR